MTTIKPILFFSLGMFLCSWAMAGNFEKTTQPPNNLFTEEQKLAITKMVFDLAPAAVETINAVEKAENIVNSSIKIMEDEKKKQEYFDFKRSFYEYQKQQENELEKLRTRITELESQLKKHLKKEEKPF